MMSKPAHLSLQRTFCPLLRRHQNVTSSIFIFKISFCFSWTPEVLKSTNPFVLIQKCFKPLYSTESTMISNLLSAKPKNKWRVTQQCDMIAMILLQGHLSTCHLHSSILPTQGFKFLLQLLGVVSKFTLCGQNGDVFVFSRNRRTIFSLVAVPSLLHRSHKVNILLRGSSCGSSSPYRSLHHENVRVPWHIVLLKGRERRKEEVWYVLPKMYSYSQGCSFLYREMIKNLSAHHVCLYSLVCVLCHVESINKTSGLNPCPQTRQSRYTDPSLSGQTRFTWCGL